MIGKQEDNKHSKAEDSVYLDSNKKQKQARDPEREAVTTPREQREDILHL